MLNEKLHIERKKSKVQCNSKFLRKGLIWSSGTSINLENLERYKIYSMMLVAVGYSAHF